MNLDTTLTTENLAQAHERRIAHIHFDSLEHAIVAPAGTRPSKQELAEWRWLIAEARRG